MRPSSPKEVAERLDTGVEAARVAEVEAAVGPVHAIEVVCVIAEDGLRLDGVETGGVFRIEALHGSHLRKSLVKGRDLRVPGAGAALFHGSVDGGGVCDALRSVAEQAFEDALMHAGEALRFQQRLHA